MPKLKTKSAAKKRFKISATGKLIAPQARNNHLRRKRSNWRIRDLRGTVALNTQDSRNIIRFCFPYS